MYEASGWSCESSLGGLFRQEGENWIRFSYINKIKLLSNLTRNISMLLPR